jgi:short-subunit dehydrogenase
MDLRDKVVVITGASRGIGAHLAQGFATRGSRLVLAARSGDDLEAVARELRDGGTSVLTVPTDISDRGQNQNLVERTIEEHGAIDVLINNAGVERYSRFHEKDLDGIESVLRTNVIGTVTLTRLAVPHMIERGRGHVVNIASMAGKSAIAYNVDYSTSKHALVGFSWSLRAELAPLGIGVSVVCPIFVQEAGMHHNRNPNETPPAAAGAVPMKAVVDATLKAVERNKAEILVTKPLGKVSDVLAAVSPDALIAVQRRLGIYRFLEEQIDKEKPVGS